MTNKTLVLIFILSILTACQPESGYEKLSGSTMGTTYHITFKEAATDLSQLHNQVEQELKLINQLMSTYINDSELSLFNQNHRSECIKLSPKTLYVVDNANLVSQQTGGKFDITLAPLIEAWGFDKKQTNNQIPTQQVLSDLLDTIGYTKLELMDNCIKKDNPSLSINLSAIAKGYAVDEIARILQANNIQHYLVEIGGEVATKGVNAKNKDWRIAIESAASAERNIQRIISTQGMGVATSGDYRNYFEKDGKRYSHTIDPTTGYPITHKLASVTVLHPQTMLADAYATAMMVMGETEALAFANKHQLPVFMLVKQADGFKEIYNAHIESYLQ